MQNSNFRTPPSNKGSPNQPGNHHHQCVCQICTCGNHTCPKPSVRFDADTSYHKDYKEYQVLPHQQERLMTAPIQKRYDPKDIKSTYQTSYVGHPIEYDSSPKQKFAYKQSSTRLDDQTQYRKNYIPNKMEIKDQKTPQYYIQNKAKFQGKTTYNSQYSPKQPQNNSQYIKQDTYLPKNLPFQGKTTYECEYTPHKIENVRPESNFQYRSNNNPFEGQSRYKQDYREHMLNRKQRCAVQGLPQRPIRCSPGKQHLHYSAEKGNWE